MKKLFTILLLVIALTGSLSAAERTSYRWSRREVASKPEQSVVTKRIGSRPASPDVRRYVVRDAVTKRRLSTKRVDAAKLQHFAPATEVFIVTDGRFQEGEIGPGCHIFAFGGDFEFFLRGRSQGIFLESQLVGYCADETVQGESWRLVEVSAP